MRMMRYAALAVCLALPAWAQEAEPSQLTVTGSGEAAAAPDMATITLGVSERAASASQAMNAASGVADKIIARLVGFGIEARDVQTSSLSLNPYYVDTRSPGNTPEVGGYEASNLVTVRLRDLERVGEVLGAVLEDGANSLNGLTFSVADPEPLLNDARRRAVADARARATLYAEAAGVTLGRLISLQDQTGGMPRPMPMAEMRMAASVPVAGGETGYSADVTMVYEIIQ